MIAAVKNQVEMGGLSSEQEEAAEIEAGQLWRAQLYSAIRTFILSYTANGQKGYDACAAALDKRWGGEVGRPVSASALRSALHDSERNNFRAEWLDWFACRSPEVADCMARRVRPTKTDKEYIADLEAEVREEIPRRADAVFRRARAR